MLKRLAVIGGLCVLMLLSGVSAQDTDTLPYQDSSLPIEERVTDLLDRMTLDEKLGQMTLIEKDSIRPPAVTDYAIGAILSGGGGYPTGNNSADGWLEMVHAYQDAALATRLGIPMLYGVDAIHGHNNLSGAVIFPHNIGLGAANNPELVEEIGRITALEMIATGIYWNYAPVLAVPQDIRWGRAYEGYSENTEMVTELSVAMLRGLQGDDLSAPDTVLGTPKHFVGDGGTAFGTSPQDGGFLDRGITQVDEATLREIHLPPYPAAIENGARSIMISYSSWGGENMHGQAYLIQDVLRDELGFEGFIVSDWGGIDVVAPSYYDAVVKSVNAGIDLNMVPYNYIGFIRALDEAVEKEDISMERIDEAVASILQVKFELGLFENPYGDAELQALIGSEAHREVARDAVRQSLVLLKNENNALPLSADDEQTVFIAGRAADNIGIQSGGWTIEWQGAAANLTEGTSVRRGLQNAFGDETTVRYSLTGSFNDDAGNPAQGDVGIVVVGEEPYAEWFGDDPILTLSLRDRELIEKVRGQVDSLIVVLLSGRPMIVDESLNLADAFVAAWLPGTEGAGVADVLLGDNDFVGTLPYTWPRTTDQLPFDFDAIPTEGCEAPLFPFGYGLTYDSTPDESAEWLSLSVDCAPEEVVVEEVEVVIPDADLLAPEGSAGMMYNAPFPVAIALDGEFEDWAGVPQVTLPRNTGQITDADPAISFTAAADDTYLYLMGHVTDSTIISGEHGSNYWNEDSIEFYINASGDLELSSYTDAVAQITVPALNIQQPEDAVLSGVNHANARADLVAVKTADGWAVEVAVPLENEAWLIVPEQDTEIGFQVHLNGASVSDRDTKLIWSTADTSDQSYQNPSLFGRLIFQEVSADSADSATEDTPAADSLADAPNLLTDDPRTWELVWQDEFEGDSVDPTKWGYQTMGTGGGNNELQYYSDRPENSYVEDGNLHIVAREEDYRFRDYTSARIWTVASMTMTYGRIDVRAKLPQGQGLWPAIWMLPINSSYGGWPASGEIDIMELVGHEPDTVHGTLHYTGDEFGTHQYTGDSYILDDGTFADEFHVFSLVWEEGRFEWYVDGELYQVQTEWQSAGNEYPAPFDHAFYLIMNVAVGGEWPGSPDETTTFPQTMTVDYVRVYEQSE